MLQKIRSFLSSPYYSVLILSVSALSYLLGDATLVIGMFLLVLLIAATLVTSDDLAHVFLPVLSVIVLGTTLIGRFELITPYIPYAYPLILAVLFHLIAYRKPFRPGISLYGVLATAAAILISGMGNRDATNYGDPTVIYYLAAMSVGLVLFYFLFAGEVKRNTGKDRLEDFLISLCYVGVLCSVVVVYNLLKWVLGYAGGTEVNDYYALIPYRNTIANLLALCLPAPFYFAGYVLKRHSAQVAMFLVGAFFYATMLMTVARTAMLFGTVVFICCFIYYLKGRVEWYFKIAGVCVLGVGLVAFGISVYEPILELFGSRLQDGLASVGEARWQLFLRSLTDFVEHPIFGIGFASSQNSDIYIAEGCISWYHLYFPQIWGSLGLAGCVAFGYQFVVRLKLVFCHPTAKTVAVSLSYLALLLYSQTDPGEFVPIPFAALGILMFVLLEHHAEKSAAACAPAEDSTPPLQESEQI